MLKFRHLYIGKDSYLLDVDYPEEFMYDCTRYCQQSYDGNNIENLLHPYDVEDQAIQNIVLQAVLDTKLIRSLLLEEYTEGKKE